MSGKFKFKTSIIPKPLQDDTKDKDIHNENNLINNKLDDVITEIYVKMDQIESILQNPGMYVGSTELDNIKMYVLNDEDKMIEETLSFTPALYKLYDEALVNARDHHIRVNEIIMRQKKILNGVLPHDNTIDNDYTYHPVKNIHIDVNEIDGTISIKNDGEGIDVIVHKKEGIYVPHLIFGTLLSSTNFNKNKERVVGGKHGLGAKLCNIFSKEFTIETIDSYRGLHYTQTFKDNMSSWSKPIVKKSSLLPYTKVTFKPDFARFGMSGITNDLFKLFKKRAYDIAGTSNGDINIHFNKKKIGIKSFERYVDLYIGTRSEHKRLFYQCNEDWEFSVCASPDGKFEQISFVNGICTYKGGKHVDHVRDVICKRLCTYANEHKKGMKDLKEKDIEKNIMIFVNCTINDPDFDNQIKDTMTKKITTFRSKCTIDDKCIEKMASNDMNILDSAMALTKLKEEKSLKSLNATSSRRKHINIEKLDDASYAGTDKSSKCILILTEGDSAKTTALTCISGLKNAEEKLYYGVYPLRGKMINPKDAKVKRIEENIVLKSIMEIIGLEIGKDYLIDTNFKKLRYGKLYLMTDSDVDGDHIKGLLFNIFHEYFPTLLKRSDFLYSPLTPLIKATLDSHGNKSNLQKFEFYSESEYRKWSITAPSHKIKYYKGLGTSSKLEAKEYFKNIKLQNYYWNIDHNNDDKIKLAFSKKLADNRKTWIVDYLKNIEENKMKDEKIDKLSYSEFIDERLIKFSVYDNDRSIPHILDGLKPSQRKILEGVLLRTNPFSEIKVAQLAGIVSEKLHYHHGEQSLNDTIVNMAQDYTGSNNINILIPEGQFGSRVQNGKDASSARYIHTYLSKWTDIIFNKDDREILTYLDDDGQIIEPVYMCPVIPIVLINGSRGIGTGWSSEIPCYNPFDIIENIKNYLSGKSFNKMIPYYRGFKGSIITTEVEGKYKIIGCYTRTSPVDIVITEIPVGTKDCYSFDDYNDYIKSLYFDENSILNDISNTIDENDGIIYNIKFNDAKDLDKLLENIDEFERMFKLSNTINTSNMHLFNTNGIMNKYNSPDEILQEFCETRLHMYIERKNYILYNLQRDIDIYSEKIRFISYVIDHDHEIKIGNVTKTQLLDLIIKYNFKLPLKPHKRKMKNDLLNNENIKKNEDEDEEHINNERTGNYNYLINIPMYQATIDEVKKLKKKLELVLDEYNRINNISINDMWINDLDLVTKSLMEKGSPYGPKANIGETLRINSNTTKFKFSNKIMKENQ